MIGEHSGRRVRCLCKLDVSTTRQGTLPNSGVVFVHYALELRHLVGGHVPYHNSPRFLLPDLWSTGNRFPNLW